jgi:hypothetical protein
MAVPEEAESVAPIWFRKYQSATCAVVKAERSDTVREDVDMISPPCVDCFFLRIDKSESLNFFLRDPAFQVLLKMVR